MDAKFSATVGRTIGIDSLKSYLGQSVTVPKFQVHLEKKIPCFCKLFPRNKNKLKGANSGE
jgi:hypothetical protein